ELHVSNEELKQLERKQYQLAQQRQLALDAAHMGWWHYDPVKDVYTYDEKYKEIFGVSGSESPNQEILKRLHREDLPQVWAKVEAALDPKDPKSYSAEYRIFKDKEVRWIEANGITIFEGQDNSQVAKGLVGTVRDITERKNAEEKMQELYENLQQFAEELEVSNEELHATTEELQAANEELRESRETLLEFFDNPLNGFASCEIITNENGEPVDFVYLEVNDTFETFTGLKKEEVINKRVNEIFDPDEVADLIKIYGKVALTGENAGFEYSIPSLNKYYEVSTFSPKKGRFIAFFTDITGRKKAEKERDRFFNLSIDMLCISDFDGYFKQLNPAFETVLGWTKEELMSKPYIEFVHPDDREATINESKNLSKGQKTVRFENRYLCKDGSYKNLSWNAYSLTDEKLIFSTVRDITDRKKAVKALKESEEKYKWLFNSSPLYLILVGLDGCLMDVNEAASDFAGVSKNDIIGKRFDEIGVIPEEELQLHYKNVSQVLKGDVIEPYEARYIDKNGKIHYTITSESPLIKDGKINGFQIICLDLTESKKVEEALKESERKFREVFNKANDMISLNLMNEDKLPDNFIEINDVAVQRLGYSKEELLKMGPRDIVSPEKRIEMQENAKELYKTGHNTFEIEHVTKNGKKIPVEINNHLIRYNGREVCLAISRDITERKKIENEVKESLREKEILLREIHHRVKNNLQIISSLLNLQRESVEEEESIDVLIESRNRIQTMALIHEELYRSSSLKDINFKDFIYSLTANLFYSYGVDSRKIERIIDVEDLYMGIDTAIPCGLIINELVTNSLKYAFSSPDDKGCIKVELKKKEDEFYLILEDSGMGIPEDIKIEDTETLGLKMVESLVHQLDGNIELDRTNGTKFTISFKELKYKDRI
ncbi:MAG TPA: PAS domain S-box protein, partial [Methanobacterium sp.]|nr:PAS domain S-box protein [Methanobacterium sp.]